MDVESGKTVLGGFNETQVATLTGLSIRQLRSWARSGFYLPAFGPHSDSAMPASLYDFRDLVCLKVIGLLRNSHRVSLNELRKTKHGLAHLGRDLWSATTLFVLNKKVVFENPETGVREEATSGQGVLTIPLLVVSGEMEDAARRIRQRDPATVGRIERKRGVLNSRPTIAGTRILVDTVVSFARDGFSPSKIIEQYPSLSNEDISAALHFKETA